MDKSKKNIFSKILYNQKFLTLLGLAAIILISVPFAKNSIKQYRINKEINGLKKEISELQDKNSDLKNFVSYLESDQFAEEQARLKLGLKKPGEELTVIKKGDNEAPAGAVLPNNIFNIPGYNKEKPPRLAANPEKWFYYFFK
ncbi:MAG: septum formation initiator family protein [bacterium]|nr:septum formation initiator family protein [bacterium]